MSSVTGNHDNHMGRMLSTGACDSRCLHIFATAEIAFSVALVEAVSSRAVGDWMVAVRNGRASIRININNCI